MPTSSPPIFQFKITLLESNPPIWRRIQVRDCDLIEFHEHLQTAMGWTNSHLHQYEIDGERYGIAEMLDAGFDDDFECHDSETTRLKDFINPDEGEFAFLYEYDFGDGWQHEILFEKCVPAEKSMKYPLCIEGERNCPPEDVGGVWGYSDFLEAIADPKHEQHQDYVDWIGNFDPEEFDAGKITKRMRKGLGEWR